MLWIFALAASLAALASIAAYSQEPQQAAQQGQQVAQREPQQAARQLPPVPGRGLLPKPYKTPATIEGVPTPHPFKPDPSGGLSRTIFETDEDPNFKIIIRDLMFPPDRQPHTVTFPSALFLHFFGEPDGIKVAGQPLTLHAGERTAVAANTPVEVANKGDRSIVVRAFIVEAK